MTEKTKIDKIIQDLEMFDRKTLLNYAKTMVIYFEANQVKVLKDLENFDYETLLNFAKTFVLVLESQFGGMEITFD